MCEKNGTVGMLDGGLQVGPPGEGLMFPAAAVLVFLLYLLLIHELLSQFCSSGKPKEGYISKGGSTIGYRPRAQPMETRKPLHSLDVLWKRMKAASENFRLNGLKHAMITEAMAEARAEARLHIQGQERVASIFRSLDHG